MAAIIGSFIWLYMYTVDKTSLATQIATVQTLPTEEGKETVLSITLKDGSNVKYLIKAPTAEMLSSKKDGPSKEKVSSYEMSQLRSAFNVGESPLSPGIAVKVAD